MSNRRPVPATTAPPLTHKLDLNVKPVLPAKPPAPLPDPVVMVKDRLATTSAIHADIAHLARKYGEDVLRECLGKIGGEPPPIDFSLMLVTPNDARALLGPDGAKNLHNRSLSPANVTRYAGDMTADAWPLTHQAFAVGPDGDLVDGQHRLEAIIKSDKSIFMMMAIYRDPAVAALARSHIDIGRARRGGDILEIGGSAEKGLGKRVYSVTTALVAISDSLPWGGWTTALITARYEKERAGIDFAAKLPPRQFAAPIAAAFAYAHPVDPERVMQFAATVQDKTNIEAGSAAQHYVLAVASGAIVGSREKTRDRSDVSHRVTRLIVGHLEGEQIGKLQTSKKGTEWLATKRRALGLS